MRILYITTIGITMTFFKHLIKELLDEGHTVDIICNENDEKVPDCYRDWNCNIYHHSCSRSPLSKGNLQAIGQIKKLVKEKHYDIVHCHTPIAAMCTRAACRGLRKSGVKVIYTAHGFHFYKGAPIFNWMIYYPIEKICSRWTDVLITINHEDYELAKRKMKARKVEYVPGVGIDVNKFADVKMDVFLKRYELGIPADAKIILSVGELNKNKNQIMILEAISNIGSEKLHYLVVGEGELKEHLVEYTKKNHIDKQVHFLGYRTDVEELYKIADVFVHPSFREGLPVAVLEAIASGLPCIVSNVRGNVDLIGGNEGRVFEVSNLKSLMDSIEMVMHRKNPQTHSYENAKLYSYYVINDMMLEIYQRR